MGLKRFVLLIVMLALPTALAGCFRTAGNTVEPTTQDASSSEVVQEATASTPAGEVLTTSTLPPITVLAPNTRAPATETPSEATVTRAPQTIEPPPTATPQFITPGSPLGPLVVDTTEPLAQIETTDDAGSALSGDSEAGDTPGSDDPCIYVVQSGDTLYGIALDFDTTVEDLLAANPTLEGDSPVLYPDDELQLPDCDPSVTRTPTRAPSATPSPAPGTETAGEVYTVEPGDTLFNIAIAYGLTVQDIVNANPGLDPDRLSIGQRIVIPASED